MSDGRGGTRLSGNPPTGHNQRETFIAAYERHQNLSAAMREAGIRSRSSAYRWLRWYQEGGRDNLAPRSHARQTKRIPAEVKDQIIALRQLHPSWGRRRIATELECLHGRRAVSQSGVEGVLRERGLWTGSAKLPEGRMASRVPSRRGLRRLETDELLTSVQHGIQLDIHNDAQAAVSVLIGEVWILLGREPDLRNALLSEPEVGSWLLRSLVQLAHALIDTGRWYSALGWLEEARRWMASHPPDRRQTAYQEQALWISRGPAEAWMANPLGGPVPLGVEPVSLRQDDLWVECCQYLGVVLRGDPRTRGLDHLYDALTAFGRTSRREVLPIRASHYRGVLEHDVAQLMLSIGAFANDQIMPHLIQAQECLGQEDNHAMLARVSMVQAGLHQRTAASHSSSGPATVNPDRTRALERMEIAIATAIDHAERDPSPILMTSTFIDAATLLLAADMVAEVDVPRLRRAAETCVSHGSGEHAHRLLFLPGIERFLSEATLAALRRILPGSHIPSP